MKVNLSVVIITFNEEANIARCLDAVEGIADEVVVVDSFSTDQTKEICIQRGVRFFERAFDGYVTQKNFANAQAVYPHILSLDADEVLSEELKQAVLALKHNWINDGYYLSRVTNYCSAWIRHGGWYPDRKLRLYDRRKGKWEGLLLHEKFELTGDSTSSSVKGDLLHYSYTSITQHLNQINLFTDIALEEMKQEKKRVFILGLIVKPSFRFVRMYFMKLGFMDGFEGFCIATLSAYAVFVKYAKLYMYNKYKA